MNPYHRVVSVPLVDSPRWAADYAHRRETSRQRIPSGRSDEFRVGDCSMAVFGATTGHRWEGLSPLTIKFYGKGEGLYETHDGLHRLNSGYLILNEGCQYRVVLDSEVPVHPYALFLAPQFAERVAAAMAETADRNLDNPFPEPVSSRRFFERIGRGDNLHRRLILFANEFDHWRTDPLWLSEQFHDIASAMIAQCGDTWREVNAIVASRPETREEIYRRLWKARDWAHAMLDQEVTLGDMADIACMSESYFLRTFKVNFKQTPHQFVIDLRLERARSLLKETTKSVTEITEAIGFQSLGSFSWMFKKRHGVSPDAYRRAIRD